MTDKWKRRDKKKQKNKMPVHGKGLLTVIAPIQKQKAGK